MRQDAPSPAVRVASDAAMSWLQGTAWPLWLACGIDKAPAGQAIGFHEHLTLSGYRCAAEFRRLRVVTRQIYVFSEAAAAGLAGAKEAVALGLDYLQRHAFDPSGGYHWRFDLNGNVTDSRRDLYDHAFVLLALASAMRVLPSPALRDEATRLDNYFQTAFRHAQGGYGESLPASLPRRQNPHMHLLEACLAASEVFGNTPFLDRADELIGLFLSRMLQATEGALPEYFDDALAPVRIDGRFVVEPGHHSEWVWLLHWYARRRADAGRPPLATAATALCSLTLFTDRYGIHPETGGLMDELWSDGSVKSSEQRLWPQTERLKAEILRPDAEEARVLQAYAVLNSYIAPAPAGLWLERRLADGAFTREAAPASSLYHLTAAVLVAHRALAANAER